MKTAAGVLGLPSADSQRFVVHHSRCVQAIIHGCQVNESFERRTGLPLCKYCAVEFILTAAADHGFNVTVGRIKSDQAYLGLRQMVGIICPYIGKIPDRTLCLGLHTAVQGSVNFQAAFVEHISAVFVDDLLADVIEEVRTEVFFLAVGFFFADLYIFRFGFCCVSLCDMSVFYHLVKNDITAFLIGLGIFHGVIIVGAFGNGSQRSCFCQVDVLYMFPKIREGSRFYTVSAFPKVNLVQVHVQYFVFGVFVFHLSGQESFLDFTGNGTFLCKEGIFRKLLGDGAATLYFLSFEVTDKSAEGTAVVDAAVLVETVVFNRNKSCPDMLGDLVHFYRKPVLGRSGGINYFIFIIIELGNRIRNQAFFHGRIGD